MKAWHATRKFWLEIAAFLAGAVLASVIVAPALGQGMSPSAPGSPACSPSSPETGRTPVIPPPGSPGGDPSIRPK
jgi:hypothetical protein